MSCEIKLGSSLIRFSLFSFSFAVLNNKSVLFSFIITSLFVVVVVVVVESGINSFAVKNGSSFLVVFKLSG
jgi:hypothetical protein